MYVILCIQQGWRDDEYTIVAADWGCNNIYYIIEFTNKYLNLNINITPLNEINKSVC